MPAYYFATYYGDIEHVFDDPLDLSGDAEAWREAAAATGEILRDISDDLEPNREWRLEVRNQRRELIYRFRVIPEALA